MLPQNFYGSCAADKGGSLETLLYWTGSCIFDDKRPYIYWLITTSCLCCLYLTIQVTTPLTFIPDKTIYNHGPTKIIQKD